tara:strand:- start:4513 stop:4758 length:246 start_codon:yes stop_codon:yes gene_type:complete
MWKYTCVLCNDFNSDDTLCSKCKDTKKIVDLYGINVVNSTLVSVFVRGTIPIQNRTDQETKIILTRSKGLKTLTPMASIQE